MFGKKSRKILTGLLSAVVLAAASCASAPAKTDDNYKTDPIPEGRPAPVEPQDAVVDEDTEYTCKFSIICTVLVGNDELDPEKRELVPADGIIFPETEVVFYDGESVFNLLRRVCRQNSIHLEFVDTPLYNTAYIEGIGNLYEFDAGKLSGWLYSVNGWYPNYGSSRYRLHDGDSVVWEYTVDIGEGQLGQPMED